MNNETAKNTYSEEATKEIERKSSFELTKEEYFDIAERITSGDSTGYDLLLERAKKNLKDYVKWKCFRMGLADFADDAMQLLYIRLFTSVVTGYFRHGGEGINPDYRGLSAWMKRVADNIIKDVAREQYRYYSQTSTLTGDTDGKKGESEPQRDIPDTRKGPEEEVIDDIANKDTLKECLDTVLGTGNAIYKILAWLGHRVIVYKHGVDDSEANRLLVKNAEDKTLFDLYDILLEESKYIEWLSFSDQQQTAIRNALSKTVGGKAMGDSLLKEFYMAKGPENTISDWRNRLDTLLKGRMGSDGGAKKTPVKGEEEKK